MGIGSEGVPTGPWVLHLAARLLAHLLGAATALCLCVIWTVASAHPHLAPPPPGTVGSHLATAISNASTESPFPGEFLVKSFQVSFQCFHLFPTFVRVMGSGEGGPRRRSRPGE